QEVQQTKELILNHPILGNIKNYNSKILISDIQNQDWFISRDYKEIIHVEGKDIILKQDPTKFIYISYLERNINFTKRPKDKLFDLDLEKMY
ncbi:hypothetical protein WAJ08_20980, partial [Acinetobacter baumannii]